PGCGRVGRGVLRAPTGRAAARNLRRDADSRRAVGSRRARAGRLGRERFGCRGAGDGLRGVGPGRGVALGRMARFGARSSRCSGPVSVLLALVVGFLVGRLLLLGLLPVLASPILERENYRGHVLPTAAGIVIVLTVVAIEGVRVLAHALGVGDVTTNIARH